MPTVLAVKKATICYFKPGTNEKAREVVLTGRNGNAVRFSLHVGEDAKAQGYPCPVVFISGTNASSEEKRLAVPLDGGAANLVLSSRAAVDGKLTVWNKARGFMAMGDGALSPQAVATFIKCVAAGREATAVERGILAQGAAPKPYFLSISRTLPQPPPAQAGSSAAGGKASGPHASSSSSLSSNPPSRCSSVDSRSSASTADTARAAGPSASAVPDSDGILDESQLSPEQRHVVVAIKAGKNVFCSGPGGSGKSSLLRLLQQRILPAYPYSAFTATTSTAALLIGGQTIHSWSGLTPEMAAAYHFGVWSSDVICERIRKERPAAVERWRVAKTLVLDEVSMLDASNFTLLDAMGKTFRREYSHRPFGGLQVVCSGDFAQLPPVQEAAGSIMAVVGSSDSAVSAAGAAAGAAAPKETLFAFQSPVWDSTFSLSLDLPTVFRQGNDAAFVAMLREIRWGQCSETTRKALAARYVEADADRDRAGSGIVPTHLHAHVKSVDRENTTQLQSLAGRLVTFAASDQVYHSECTTERINKRCPGAAPAVTLKQGAQVMMTRAVDQAAGLVNGSKGVVLGFEDPSPTVRTFSNNEIRSFQGRSRASDAHGPSSHGTSSACGLPIVYFPNAKPSKDNPSLSLAALKDLESRGKITLPAGFASGATRGLFIVVKPFEFVLKDNAPLSTFRKTAAAGGAGSAAIPSATYLALSVAAVRYQLPLALAWAVSIHRSQGATLDLVRADLSRVFEYGQAYVCLSRCRSLSALTLSAPFDPSGIKAHPEVIRFYERMSKASATSSRPSSASSSFLATAALPAPLVAVPPPVVGPGGRIGRSATGVDSSSVVSSRASSVSTGAAAQIGHRLAAAAITREAPKPPAVSMGQVNEVTKKRPLERHEFSRSPSVKETSTAMGRPQLDGRSPALKMRVMAVPAANDGSSGEVPAARAALKQVQGNAAGQGVGSSKLRAEGSAPSDRLSRLLRYDDA